MKFFLVVVFAGLVAPKLSVTQQPKVPAVSADNTTVAHPPQPLEPGVRGYGIRGVEGRTLSEMVAVCQSRAGFSQLQNARCDQLKRTLKTQPDGGIEDTLKRGR